MKYYTATHEWCDLETSKVGLSKFAKNELGEIVYLQLPALNKEVRLGEELCILESTKAAADVYAPYAGVVTAVNDEAIHFINEDPEGKGWLVKITPSKEVKLQELLDEKAYLQLIQDPS
jgi:glycine cleavage system H protein